MDKDALRQGKWDAIRELEEDESKIDIIFALFGVTNDPFDDVMERTISG